MLLLVLLLVLKIVPLLVLVLVRVLIPGGLPRGDVTMVLVRNLQKWVDALLEINFVVFTLARVKIVPVMIHCPRYRGNVLIPFVDQVSKTLFYLHIRRWTQTDCSCILARPSAYHLCLRISIVGYVHSNFMNGIRSILQHVTK